MVKGWKAHWRLRKGLAHLSARPADQKRVPDDSEILQAVRAAIKKFARKGGLQVVSGPYVIHPLPDGPPHVVRLLEDRDVSASSLIGRYAVVYVPRYRFLANDAARAILDDMVGEVMES